MGNVTSDDEPVHDVDAEPFGFRVLSVAPGSPASTCKLIAEGERLLDDEDVAVEGELLDRARDEAEKRRRSASAGQLAGASNAADQSHSLVMFFDTIVAAAGERLEAEPERFVSILAAHEGKSLRLHIWNTKAMYLREVEIMPKRHDGSGLLGIITEHGSYAGSVHSALHVTDVLPFSPAERAGLVPIDDYILRAAGAEFETILDFYYFVAERAGEIVTLLVHSAGRDSIREVQMHVPGSDQVWLDNRGREHEGVGLVVEQGIEHAVPTLGTVGRNEACDERVSRSDMLKAATVAMERLRMEHEAGGAGEREEGEGYNEGESKAGQSGVYAAGAGASHAGAGATADYNGGPAGEAAVGAGTQVGDSPGDAGVSHMPSRGSSYSGVEAVARAAVEAGGEQGEQDVLEESVDGDDGKGEGGEPRL